MTAPQSGLVTIPDNLSFESAARFGYLGTAFRALRLGGCDANSTVVVNGATGTLGVCLVLLTLATGARKVLGSARNEDLLARLTALSPHRVETFSAKEGDESGELARWVRQHSDGRGADIVIAATQSGTPAEPLLAAFDSLARGGRHLPIGGVLGPLPINLNVLMSNDRRILGSLWFDVADGQQMAGLAESGLLGTSVFEHGVYRLDEVNDALALIAAADLHLGVSRSRPFKRR